MAKLDAVIFDLDGTLIDSAPDITFAVNRLMMEIGAPAFDVATIQSFVGNGARMLMTRVRAHHKLDGIGIDELTERFQRLYEAAPSAHTIVYDGVREGLQSLRNSGVKLAICTNKPEAATRIILEDLSLSQYFEAVIGGDSVDALKPDPAPVLAAMNALSVDSQASAFVGDSEIDMQAAHAANVPFYFIEGGYCHIPHADVDAVARLRTFSELPALLL